MEKRRGRPRAYDPEKAVTSATTAFWDAGFAATSLDALSAATGMNRPSLYGAFGDKRELYLKTVERYRDASAALMSELLTSDVPVRDALARVFATALGIYLAGESGPRGCFLIGTTVTESVGDPEIRAVLRGALRRFDAAFETRLRQAVERGELPEGADPAALASVASALLHSIAVRARAGESREALEHIAAAGLDLICGKPPTPRATRPARHRKERADAPTRSR
jgi:AcrR family transcriptional regulator